MVVVVIGKRGRGNEGREGCGCGSRHNVCSNWSRVVTIILLHNFRRTWWGWGRGRGERGVVMVVGIRCVFLDGETTILHNFRETWWRGGGRGMGSLSIMSVTFLSFETCHFSLSTFSQ